jgi:hypothetical protein
MNTYTTHHKEAKVFLCDLCAFVSLCCLIFVYPCWSVVNQSVESVEDFTER